MEGKVSKNHFTDKELKKPITCFVISEEKNSYDNYLAIIGLLRPKEQTQ